MRRRDFFKKTQQRRYESRSYRNPYFQLKTSPTKIKWIIGSVGAILVIFTGVFFVFGHTVFAIKKVNIHGIQHADRDHVQQVIRDTLNQRRGLFFREQNRFLFKSETLKEVLNSTFTFRDLQIEQKGSQINISAIERTSQLLWKSKDLLYVVDLEGVVMRQIETSEEENLLTILPLFVDRNDVSVGVGDHVLEASETDAVFRFQEHLRAQGIQFTQTEFDRLSGKWVGVFTQDKYHILFDPSGDIDSQASRLEALLREKIEEPSKLEYIDLRFGDHVYFK